MSATKNGSFARRLRAGRLYRHGDDRLLVVPLDHPISQGPVTGGRRVNTLIGQLTRAGVDAVVLHKGALRYVDHDWFTTTGLIVHLSASTGQALDPDAKFLVAGVDEALRMGADAVSVHVNLGSDQEMQQIADLATVGDACDRWNVPLLAMIYPRGPRIADPNDPALVAHAASVASDLGADLVKTVVTEPLSALEEITRTCPIPLVVAGGPVRSGEDLTRFATGVLDAGAAGLAIGRTVFQADDPGAVARHLSDLVHPCAGTAFDAPDPAHTVPTQIGVPA